MRALVLLLLVVVSFLLVVKFYPTSTAEAGGPGGPGGPGGGVEDVGVEQEARPAGGFLSRPEGATPEPSRAMDNSLSWHLITQLCALLDVTPARTETDAHYRIQIPFPKAPEDPEVLAQYEDVTPAPWWN